MGNQRRQVNYLLAQSHDRGGINAVKGKLPASHTGLGLFFSNKLLGSMLKFNFIELGKKGCLTVKYIM